MISGFEIRTEMGSAEPYRLFRALRERDGSAVLLKTCDLDGDIERTALAREFEILRALTGARVLNALEHVDHHRTAAVVLHDPGGQPLLEFSPRENFRSS